MAIRVARDEAIPNVDEAILSCWATEQAELLSNLNIGNEELAQAASIVRVCGGDTGNLPIAFGEHGWMNVREITEWFNVPDEVLIVQDAAVSNIRRTGKKVILHQNVLVTNVGAPGVLSRNPFNTPWIDWPSVKPKDEWQKSSYKFHSITLKGLVVEALANAWSSSLKDVLCVSLFSTDEIDHEREIGLVDGEPIIHSVSGVIRNPKKYTQ